MREEAVVRILLTSHGYPPTISGVTLVVQKLARTLVGRGHQVTVLTGSDRFHAYECEDEGVRVLRMASRRNPFWPANPVPLTSRASFKRHVESVRPDVIHVHDALPLCVQAIQTSRRAGIPIVATCHYYPSFVASYLTHHRIPFDLVEGVTWRYSVALYNHFDRAIFPTFTHRDTFVAHGLASPTAVVSNGVDTSRYRPGSAPPGLAARYRLPEGPRVLAVGRLAKDKDVELLIGSMAETLSTPAPNLLIVGDGPHGDALKAYAREAGVAERVHFLGFVPESDLPALYCASDAFAIASCHEVQSIPALQAAATGLPIVAVDRGSLSEVCRDGENGLLVGASDPVALGTALDTVLDAGIGGRMGKASLRLSRLHDERVTFDMYESIYGEVSACPIDEGAWAITELAGVESRYAMPSVRPTASKASST